MLLGAASVLLLFASSAFGKVDYHALQRAEDGQLKPPQPPVKFDLKVEDILAVHKAAMDEYKTSIDVVAKLEAKDCNLTSVNQRSPHCSLGCEV